MLSLLLTLSALAHDVPPGAISLETTPGARIELVPRTDPETVEIVVHDNQKPLDIQLDRQRSEHIVDAWAISVGNGTWFVTLYTQSPKVEARLVLDRDGDGFAIETDMGAAPVKTAAQPSPSLDDLLADRVTRKPARPPRIPLRPLLGDAWMPRLDPRHVRLPFDPWKPRLTGLSDTPSMAQVDRLRKLLIQTEDPGDRAVALQYLALSHQGLGLHREARTYFDEVARTRTELPTPKVRLHQADAALATGRWERARSLCQEAHAAGAEAGATLACLGSVSLATGSPAPTPTARALLAVDERPGARLIAAQLLVIDNRFDEALPILTDTRDWPAELRPWRDATLGDVSLALGDTEGARVAWRDVGTRAPLGAVARQRARLVRLSKEAPSSWAEALPGLARDIDRGGEEAAEAHYLAAQIGRTFDETGLAAEHLTALVDHFPERTANSDVPQRLLAVCTRRLSQLHRVGRFADEAAFYDDCWREPLNAILIDPSVLTDVASAYSELGLWEQALSAQRDGVAALTRSDREDLDALTQLARLYIRVDRAREALETVSYAERLPGSAAAQPALDIVAGEAHVALDEPTQALRRWARAQGDAELGEQARMLRALTLAELGRCRDALPILRDVARRQDPNASVTAEEASLAAARCLIRQGEPAEALAMSRELAEAEPDGAWADQARWIASLAVYEDPSLPVPEGPAAPTATWAAVVQELQQTDHVEARIERLR